MSTVPPCGTHKHFRYIPCIPSIAMGLPIHNIAECPEGTFSSEVGNGPCETCPANSEGTGTGLTLRFSALWNNSLMLDRPDLFPRLPKLMSIDYDIMYGYAKLRAFGIKHKRLLPEFVRSAHHGGLF